ncbi:MAG: flagellar biosynthetic protein FliQ [Leptolyngbya sp. PLA3]|nr:MAG: flagellar biosynthetic protein FliQ [Cyanobacteria bacterium CYA]MCE7968878.1 flagellar biosynthetic protein FliQ [Leptolyngbya sp. PL-A3]
MYDQTTLDLVRLTLTTVLVISAPILLAGMIVGLIISLIQSVTSIQDQTLTFVPKIAIMIIVAAMLLPWVAQRLIEFTVDRLLLF